MSLIEHKNSDKTWMWKCAADYSYDEPTEEFFAMRFLSVEDATKWKETWETGKKFAQEKSEEEKKDEEKKPEGEEKAEKAEETKEEDKEKKEESAQ